MSQCLHEHTHEQPTHLGRWLPCQHLRKHTHEHGNAGYLPARAAAFLGLVN